MAGFCESDGRGWVGVAEQVGWGCLSWWLHSIQISNPINLHNTPNYCQSIKHPIKVDMAEMSHLDY